MIIYAYLDEYGEKIAQCMTDNDFEGIEFINLRPNGDIVFPEEDFRNTLGRLIRKHNPERVVFLPCRFFNSNSLPSQEVFNYYIKSSKILKQAVRDFSHAIFPFLYIHDFLDKEQDHVVKSNIIELIDLFDDYFFSIKGSGRLPIFDRIFMIESSPYGTGWCPDDTASELKDNFFSFFQVINMLSNYSSPLSIIPQFNILSDQAEKASDIKAYGSFRFKKIAYPIDYFAVNKANEDFFEVLKDVTTQKESDNKPEVSYKISKPDIKIATESAILAPNWSSFNTIHNPFQILNIDFQNAGAKLTQFRNEAIAEFRRVSESSYEILSDSLLQSRSFPAADENLKHIKQIFDGQIGQVKNIPALEDQKTGTILKAVFNEAKKSKDILGSFDEKKDSHNFSKMSSLFFIVVFFPLFAWMVSKILPESSQFIKGLIAASLDVAGTVFIFLAIHIYYVVERNRLLKKSEDSRDRLFKLLRRSTGKYYQYTQNLYWLRQIKELRYVINRIKLRYEKIRAYSDPLTSTSSPFDVAQTAHKEKKQNLFFRYILNYSNIEREYQHFKHSLYQSEEYENLKLEWPHAFMKEILKVPFSFLKRSGFEKIYKDFYENIKSGIHLASGGNNLMDLMVDRDKLALEINREVPEIANCPTGIFINASRGGHLDSGYIYIMVYVSQENLKSNIDITNINFSQGANRWDIETDQPELILGHFALNIPSEDFRP